MKSNFQVLPQTLIKIQISILIEPLQHIDMHSSKPLYFQLSSLLIYYIYYFYDVSLIQFSTHNAYIINIHTFKPFKDECRTSILRENVKMLKQVNKCMWNVACSVCTETVYKSRLDLYLICCRDVQCLPAGGRLLSQLWEINFTLACFILM